MKSPGSAARGTTTGRPIMVLFDVLGQRWTLRILWELRNGGPCTFRELRQRCEAVSPTVLNRRLKELRALNILGHDRHGYGLTDAGRELGEQLIQLDRWAERWALALEQDGSGHG